MRSTACQVIALWVPPKGAGSTSTTWPAPSTVAPTVGTRSGTSTGWVVIGRLVAR